MVKQCGRWFTKCICWKEPSPYPMSIGLRKDLVSLQDLDAPTILIENLGNGILIMLQRNLECKKRGKWRLECLCGTGPEPDLQSLRSLDDTFVILIDEPENGGLIMLQRISSTCKVCQKPWRGRICEEGPRRPALDWQSAPTDLIDECDDVHSNGARRKKRPCKRCGQLKRNCKCLGGPRRPIDEMDGRFAITYQQEPLCCPRHNSFWEDCQRPQGPRATLNATQLDGTSAASITTIVNGPPFVSCPKEARCPRCMKTPKNCTCYPFKSDPDHELSSLAVQMDNSHLKASGQEPRRCSKCDHLKIDCIFPRGLPVSLNEPQLMGTLTDLISQQDNDLTLSCWILGGVSDAKDQ